MPIAHPLVSSGFVFFKTVSILTVYFCLSVATSSAMDNIKANKLRNLIDRNGSAGLCYRRVFDDRHMKRHVGQTISGMRVLLKPDAGTGASAQSFNLFAAINLKGDPDRRYGMATCWWEPGANLTEGRKRALAFLASDDATRCMSSVSPNSAEEAGELVLGNQDEGDVLFIFNGFYQMRSGAPGARVMRDVGFTKEDRILRLSRVDLGNAPASKRSCLNR